MCQQSGISAGRADAFPVELVEPEAAEPVAPAVEPTARAQAAIAASRLLIREAELTQQTAKSGL
jgi:hypothetical protein